MCALSFLNNNHDVRVIHMNHESENSQSHQDVVTKYCQDKNIKLEVRSIDHNSGFENDKKKNGLEWAWARARHEIFKTLDSPVILGHHLDDAVETWIMSCMIGNPRLMKIKDDNILRPFIMNRKSKLISHCMTKYIPYVVDETNTDGISNTRSIIRKNMDVFTLLNPGIHTTIRNKLKQKEIET